MSNDLDFELFGFWMAFCQSIRMMRFESKVTQVSGKAAHGTHRQRGRVGEKEGVGRRERSQAGGHFQLSLIWPRGQTLARIETVHPRNRAQTTRALVVTLNAQRWLRGLCAPANQTDAETRRPDWQLTRFTSHGLKSQLEYFYGVCTDSE